MRLSCVLAGLLLLAGCASPSPTAPSPPGVARVPYGGPPILTKGATAEPTRQPTVVVLALDAARSLQPPMVDAVAPLLSGGWLAVSLDLPAHGADVRPGEDPDLPLLAWRTRLTAGDPLVSAFVERFAAVLNGLIASDMSDPRAICLLGISRGGFLAFHVAAHESRVRGVAAIVPVTDLRALWEFNGLWSDPVVVGLRVQSLAPALRGRPVFITAAAVDPRAHTPWTLELADALRSAGSDLEITIQPGAEHAITPGMAAAATLWLQRVGAAQL